MNLRIDEEGFRFRIIPDELESLLQSEGITHSLKIGESRLEYSLLPVLSGPMTLQLADGRIALSVSRDDLRKLHELGRSKHGLLICQDGIDVELQVDVKR